MAEGRARAWMGVGELNPMSDRAVNTAGGTNRLSQADISANVQQSLNEAFNILYFCFNVNYNCYTFWCKNKLSEVMPERQHLKKKITTFCCLK